jgi:hypothetical protein
MKYRKWSLENHKYQKWKKRKEIKVNHTNQILLYHLEV